MEKNKTYTLKDKCKALGPGILVVGSFIGPGTITSATRAGATYGYALLCRKWLPVWESLPRTDLQKNW